MDYFYKKERDREVSRFFNKDTLDAWNKFNAESFKEGKLTKKEKELIAVACTYMTRCPWCIESHTKKALKEGATKEEIAEVISIAAALAAGASMAHMNFALDVK